VVKIKSIQRLAYLEKDGKVVGIKLPFGMNFIKDGTKGYLIEFSKIRWKSSFLKQVVDNKKSSIGFGIDEKEREMMRIALDECGKL